jgi:dipeptidyl aminopeptidase/acylaminoacyl peptidase
MMREIQVSSSFDGSLQPVLFDGAQGDSPRPLLVGLHTWSAERRNQENVLLPLSRERNWNLLLPEFRGPNLLSNADGKNACGSSAAKQDILDAVLYIQEQNRCSTEIFLYGGSGGGHMALLMAAQKPKLWTAISAWCPITDLFQWRKQNENYRPHIEHCCGGLPDDGENIAQNYRERSPIFHAAQIAHSTTFIHHGKWDTSVPFSHSTNLYAEITRLNSEANVFLEIFDGAHEAHAERALNWFETFLQHKSAAQNLSG